MKEGDTRATTRTIWPNLSLKYWAWAHASRHFNAGATCMKRSHRLTAMSQNQRQYDHNVIKLATKCHIGSKGMTGRLTSGLDQSIDTFKPNNILALRKSNCRSFQAGRSTLKPTRLRESPGKSCSRNNSPRTRAEYSNQTDITVKYWDSILKQLYIRVQQYTQVHFNCLWNCWDICQYQYAKWHLPKMCLLWNFNPLVTRRRRPRRS